MTIAVFLPFIVIAPLAQYRAMRQGRRWPGWVTVWMALQVALLPGFLVSQTRKIIFGSRSTQQGMPQVLKPEPADLAGYWNSPNNDTNASGAQDGPTLGGKSLRAAISPGIPDGSPAWQRPWAVPR